MAVQSKTLGSRALPECPEVIVTLIERPALKLSLYHQQVSTTITFASNALRNTLIRACISLQNGTTHPLNTLKAISKLYLQLQVLVRFRASTNNNNNSININNNININMLCKLIIALFLPPLGVLLERGCHADLFINILLTILGYIPVIFDYMHLESFIILTVLGHYSRYIHHYERLTSLHQNNVQHSI